LSGTTQKQKPDCQLPGVRCLRIPHAKSWHFFYFDQYHFKTAQVDVLDMMYESQCR